MSNPFLFYRPTSPTGRLVLWCHGYMGTEEAIGYPSPAYFSKDLIDAGYTIACSYANGENWGNQGSIDANVALLAHLRARYSFSSTWLFGGSMGGLTSLNGYASGEYTGINGWAGFAPACNLGALQATSFGPSIEEAYPDGTAGYDPILKPTSNYTGKNFRAYASADDPVMNKTLQSDAFISYVGGVAARAAVVTVSGGHEDRSHWNTADLFAYLDETAT